MPKKIMPTPTPIVDWIVRLKMSGPGGATGRPPALSSRAWAASRPDS
jgi:hypothetical protein